jgi:hypothetical protein
MTPTVKRHLPGAPGRRRSLLGAGAAALLALPAAAALAPIAAQQAPPAASDSAAPRPKRSFPLFAAPDFAATGMRSTGAYRFITSNAGPADVQGNIVGTPAVQATRVSTRFTQFTEISLFATAAAGDWQRNRAVDPALNAVQGGGQALSYNYHFGPGTTHWQAADGALGIDHSGVRSSATGCLNHTISNIAAGVTLMAGSDCPETWGINGWQGRRPISQASWLQVFNSGRSGFRFDFWQVPVALQDTTRFLGDRFATYGVANDYPRERRALYGSILKGGSGEPAEQGYPLGLEWRFDAFALNSAPGIVFWQATVTNRTADIYNAGLDYDSLFVGVLARHGRSNRGRVGFDLARGTAVFNENGHNSTCDNAKAVPGQFSFGGYTGNCPSVLGFGNGASALVVLKSPIGDLRYKQFSDPTSAFYNPTSPVVDDTLTYNVGRMCGDDCIQERFQRPSTGFGVIAGREELALGGQAPSALEPFQYWQLFHPANSAPYGLGPRVDLANPRAGGGFNFFVPGGWSYENRPSGAPAGSDTLFLDTCNPTVNQCVGIWLDTMPDRSINFTRNATWLGAGPFRLAAGESKGFVIAIVAEGDSIAIERSINQAISLYQTFFAAPNLAPAPRIASVDVTPGSTRVARVRILLDNRTIGYVDPFLITLAERFEDAGASPTGSVEARLNYFNPRLGPTGKSIADSIRVLAARNVERILVYKSCDAGRNFTSSTSPNLCTRDRIIDSLGVDRGPAAYRALSPDSVQFIDNSVMAGQSYYYAFVPVTRGVRLQLSDSTAATGRRVVDTALVAATSALPAAGQPNIVTVYVPASLQAGGEPPRARFTREVGPKTLDRVPGTDRDTSWNGLSVRVVDSIPEQLDYRLVFGDTVVVREYATTGVVDSTVVIVRRNAVTGYNWATGSGATGANIILGRYATSEAVGASPARRARLDTLKFVSTANAPIPILGTGTTGTPVTTQVGAVRIRTWTMGNAGSFVTSAAGAVHVGPAPQAVLLLRQGANYVPVFVSNRLEANLVNNNAAIFSDPNFRDVVVEILNRPVIANWTAANNGGAQRVETFYEAVGAGRIRSAQPDQPTITWPSGVSRFVGTSFGDYAVSWSGPDFGPLAPFTFNRGLAGLEQDFTISVGNRVNAGQTDTSAEVLNAINIFLAGSGTTFTADSLISVGIPFTIRDRSSDRDVIVAMRRADKYTTYLLGTGPDTGRVTVPANQWVPGEPVILLERVRVAQASGGVVERDGAGDPIYRDTLLVLAYRAVIGCSATAPFTCNPLVGRGGTGFVSTSPERVLVARYAVPYTSEREFDFTVTPLMAGARIARVGRAQLDSVRVVPNPYILYSNYETNPTNEQRIMFTHLPPQGEIRIYTAAGQFVQRLRWTPAELNGNGDLYFNLITREGLEMASGLYLYTVTAFNESGGSTKGRQIGRFIIIR